MTEKTRAAIPKASTGGRIKNFNDLLDDILPNFKSTEDLSYYIDKNRDNVIPRFEFVQRIKTLVPDIDNVTLRDIFDELDTQGIGEIKTKEFEKIVNARGGRRKAEDEPSYKDLKEIFEYVSSRKNWNVDQFLKSFNRNRNGDIDRLDFVYGIEKLMSNIERPNLIKIWGELSPENAPITENELRKRIEKLSESDDYTQKDIEVKLKRTHKDNHEAIIAEFRPREGLVRKEEFENCIYRLYPRMTKGNMRDLWDKVDPDDRGEISLFVLKKFLALPLSTRAEAEEEKKREELIYIFQRKLMTFIELKEMEFVEKCREYTTSDEINLNDLKKVLENYGLPIVINDLRKVLEKLRSPIKAYQIDYKDFIRKVRAFDEAETLSEFDLLLSRLKKNFKNRDMIKIFRVYDVDSSNKIHLKDAVEEMNKVI